MLYPNPVCLVSYYHSVYGPIEKLRKNQKTTGSCSPQQKRLGGPSQKKEGSL